jgi:hypothetical protein
MTRWKRAFVAALTLVIAVGSLAACAVQKNISPDEPLLPLGDDGVIVGSITAPLVGYKGEVMLFEYAAEDGESEGYLTSGSRWRNWYMDAGLEPFDPGLEAQLGRMFAVRLPSGTFAIKDVWMHSRTPRVYAPATFVVLPGEVTYIGNFDVDFCVGPVTSHRWNAIGFRLSLLDEEARDLPLVRKRFPRVHALPIKKRLLDAHGWPAIGCAPRCRRPEHRHSETTDPRD